MTVVEAPSFRLVSASAPVPAEVQGEPVDLLTLAEASYNLPGAPAEALAPPPSCSAEYS